MTATQEKLCMACKADVSDKPRVKDSQGRYMCKPCAAKAQAQTKPAAAPKSVPKPAQPVKVEAQAAPDTFWDSPMQPTGGAKDCPECQNLLPAGSVLCTRCGYNLNEGRALKTRVTREKAVKEKGQSTSNFGGSLAANLPNALAILTIISMVGVACAAIVMPEFAIVLYFMAGIVGLAVSLAAPFFAFKDDCSGLAIGMLLGGFLTGIVGFVCQIVYIYFMSDRPLLRLYYTAALLGAIGAVVIFAMHAANDPDSVRNFDSTESVESGDQGDPGEP